MLYNMYFCFVLKLKDMKTIKTISKLTMLFAFVAITNTLMGAGNLKVNILPINTEKALIAISNSEASNYRITIEDSKGEFVYNKIADSTNPDFRKVFDFSNLSAGSYNLSVSSKGATVKRSFEIGRKEIVVGTEKSILEPYFYFKNGILKISYLNFEEEKVNLNLYSNGEMIFSKNVGNKFNVNEGYNLSKLDKGVYSVVLVTNNNEFRYNVELK